MDGRIDGVDDVEGQVFRDEDWYGEELDGRRFVRCSFTDVDLTESRSRGAVFEDCSFSNCKLNASVHTNTAFVGCDFRRTSFFDVTLDGCKLAGSVVIDCVLQPLTVTGGNWTGIVMRGAELQGVDLAGVRLVEADLSESDLTGAVLRGCDLSHAVVRGAELKDADLRGAMLSAVDLAAARLSGTNSTSPERSRWPRSPARWWRSRPRGRRRWPFAEFGAVALERDEFAEHAVVVVGPVDRVGALQLRLQIGIRRRQVSSCNRASRASA